MDVVDRLVPATRRALRNYMPPALRDRINRVRAIHREDRARRAGGRGGSTFTKATANR